MVDRQDIDALLIGSLYGELSSTEEARLQVHLESHPADRTVLGDLARARHAVQESRILQVQLEPPQSVSALLLQEAARRAPRRQAARDREEGWFQRFVRSFVAHPAMAAAAMLVLVVGVAGTMYLRTGEEQLSVGTVRQDDSFAPSAVAPAPAAETASMPTGATGDAATVALDERARQDHAAGSGFGVALADGEGGNEKNQLAKQQREQLSVPAVPADKPAFAQPVVPKVAKGSPDTAPEATPEPRQEAKADPKPEAPTGVKLDLARPKKEALLRRSGPNRALEVSTPQRAPMELDEDNKQGDKAAERPAPRSDSLGAGMAPADPKPAPTTPAPGPGNAAADSSKGRGVGGAPPPAPPPPPMSVRDPNKADKAEKEGRQSASQSPPPSPSKDKAAVRQADAPASEEAKLSDPGNAELAWARDVHNRVITQVRAGNCADAARLALTLSTKAAAYYEANVQNDRELRNCLSYINAELEREADRERAQRARAAKRTTDEQQAKPKAAAKPAAPKQAAPTSK